MKKDDKEVKDDDSDVLDDVLDDDSDKDEGEDKTEKEDDECEKDDNDEEEDNEENDDEENETEDDELPNDEGETKYDGNYKIGYFKVVPSSSLDKETNSGEKSLMTTVVESFDEFDSEFASNFLDGMDEDEDEFEDSELMAKDEDFQKAEEINNTLSSTLISFDGTINPYGAIISITDILYRYGFIVPDFTLDPSVDEWIYDVQLVDENMKEIPWYLHLEILKNDDNSFYICAAVIPF